MPGVGFSVFHVDAPGTPGAEAKAAAFGGTDSIYEVRVTAVKGYVSFSMTYFEPIAVDDLEQSPSPYPFIILPEGGTETVTARCIGTSLTIFVGSANAAVDGPSTANVIITPR